VTDVSAATRSGRRAYGTSLLLLAGGGALLLVAYGLTWATAEVPLITGAADTVRTQQYSGRDLMPAAAMSGWLSLAAVAGIVATRSWGRQAVGLVALVAGLVGALAAVMFVVDPGRFTEGAASLQVGPGWLVAVVAGLGVTVAAAMAVFHGRQWPTMGVRYERRTPTARVTSEWEAQDLGQDPTDDLVE
jgi:hypothetical protein